MSKACRSVVLASFVLWFACGCEKASGDPNAGGTAGGSGGSSGGTSAGTGGVAPGIAPIPSASDGTPERPQLDATEVASFGVLEHLASGGSVTVPVRDDWNPTGGIGDLAKITPRYAVAATGEYTTVQSAVDAAVAAGGSERVYIEVAAGSYREVVCVPSNAPPITLYGAGATPSDTVIVFDNYSGKAKEATEPANPCNPNLGATTFGTSGSATFAAYAREFQAKNLTIANDTDETGIEGTQAVALMTQGDRLLFENVRLLGNQDTLYVKTPGAEVIARAYFKDSYVEGDVDFVFGRGTFVLDGCTVHYLTARQGTKGGYLTAPSTDARNPYGILIVNSELTAEEGTPQGLVHLGRAWDESQKDLATYATNVASGVYPNGQVLIRDTTIGPHIDLTTPWYTSTISRPYSSVPTTLPANRFFEYQNDGPGSALP